MIGLDTNALLDVVPVLERCYGVEREQMKAPDNHWFLCSGNAPIVSASSFLNAIRQPVDCRRLTAVARHAQASGVCLSTEVALLGRFDDSLLDVSEPTPAFDAGKGACNAMSGSGRRKLFDAKRLERGDDFAGEVIATDKRYRDDKAPLGFNQVFVNCADIADRDLDLDRTIAAIHRRQAAKLTINRGVGFVADVAHNVGDLALEFSC
jgi:hypothetical protein